MSNEEAIKILISTACRFVLSEEVDDYYRAVTHVAIELGKMEAMEFFRVPTVASGACSTDEAGLFM